MSLLSKFKDDPLFAKVIRSSGALFSSNTVANNVAHGVNITADSATITEVGGDDNLLKSYAYLQALGAE